MGVCSLGWKTGERFEITDKSEYRVDPDERTNAEGVKVIRCRHFREPSVRRKQLFQQPLKGIIVLDCRNALSKPLAHVHLRGPTNSGEANGGGPVKSIHEYDLLRFKVCEFASCPIE